MSSSQELVARIRALAERTGTSTSTLSRKLFGNGKRFDEIEAGGSLTMTTFERATRALAALEADAGQTREAA